MKNVIEDLYTLFSTESTLNNDNTTSIKVKTFRKYPDPLITDYPALLLVRKNKTSQIKTVNLGYLNTYSVDILLMTQDYEESTNCLKGIDNLDKLVEIVEGLIQKNPKIDGKYYNTEITGISFNTFTTDNYINFSAIVSLDVKKKVQYN